MQPYLLFCEYGSIMIYAVQSVSPNNGVGQFRLFMRKV